MGQKVHPYGFRLGFNKPWRLRWFATHGYSKLLQEDVDVDELYVSEAYVNEGPRMKRVRPAPMGRAYRYQRRMAHIVIRVADKEEV